MTSSYKDEPNSQSIFLTHEIPQTNGMGIAGFVLAIIAIFLGWIPVFGWILWLLGLIFSCVGLTRRPKGLAVAGFVISLIGLFFMLVLFATITAIFSAQHP